MNPSLSSFSKISMRLSILLSCLFITIIIVSSFSALLVPPTYFYANAAYTKALSAVARLTIINLNLKAEVIFKGHKIPTSIAFLGPNDILVQEKFMKCT